MKVSAYMTRKLITARPDDGVRSTFFRLRREDVHHVPVVDDDGKLVGIVSDRDLRRPEWIDEAPDISYDYALDDNLVLRDIMSTNLAVVHTYDPLKKATEALIEQKIGALPVVDKKGHLVGILSAIDLLIALDEMLEYSV